jgi:dipeptidyl aminopeptidase/acylaminoacyl peptidase
VADVSPDGRRLVITGATTHLDNNLYELDLAGGGLRLLTPHEGEHSYWGGAYSSDGRRLVIATDNHPSGMMRLARIDLESLALEFFLTEDTPWELETFAFSEDRRFLAWVLNEDGYGRVHLYDQERGRPLPAPEIDGLVSAPALSNAGFLAYGLNSPTRAPDVWIWDFREPAGLPRRDSAYDRALAREALVLPGGHGSAPAGSDPANPVQVTFASYAGIEPSIFHEPRLVRYRSFDGTEIPAFLYLPPGRAEGPVPFILEAHGGPTGQFRPAFNRHFQYLLQQGFGLLAPNFRGSTGYGRAFEDADNYKRRLDSVRDVAAGAEWLIANGYARRGGIGIKGASYGGYMTLAAMTEHPDLFAAGVDQVGIANFESFLAETADYRRSLRESEYGPMTDREFLRSISPLHKADRIRGALLVVHGANDPRVPVREARQILAAVSAQGVPVDSLIFPDEGHGIAQRGNQLRFYARMAEFFRQHLAEGADRASRPAAGE